MGFHKHKFPIRKIETCPEPIEVVSGWANDDYTYGFYRTSAKGRWIATDLESGTLICSGRIREDCVKWIKDNADKIEQKKLEPSYVQRVMEFRELLRQELDKLEGEE